jgi:adenosylcobinamide-phosphate synthase
MGRWISRGRERRTSRAPSRSLIEGALLVASGTVLVATVGAAIDALLRGAPSPLRSALRGLALKPALSLAPLVTAATQVQRALQRGHLVEARRLLGWHLVSRDTTDLSRAEVAGAAIESVAENLSDSIVAPLMAFRVGGLAGAYAYRMLNTADAMLGYHTRELEWFGKAAARADDVVNLLPSRVTAGLICCTARIGRGSPTAALRIVLRDADRTASPNAGWPMAAMAGALGLHLTKRGHYSLNDLGRPARPADIGRACRIVLASAALAALAADLS